MYNHLPTKTMFDEEENLQREKGFITLSAIIANISFLMPEHLLFFVQLCCSVFAWDSLGDVLSGVFFRFLANFTRPWVPIQWANFFSQSFVGTRLPSESLEPLIVFLAYLEPKLEAVIHLINFWRKFQKIYFNPTAHPKLIYCWWQPTHP